MTDWVYHATTSRALDAIRVHGLVPRRQPKKHRSEKRGTRDAVVFFAIKEDGASIWGPVLLRFPFPDEAEPDPYSDTTYVTGYGAVETNWYTREHIPPETIQVKTASGWTSLTRRRFS